MGTPKTHMWKHKGLLYCLLNSKPLQASVIINGTRASLPFREEIPRPWSLTHAKTVRILDLSDNCFCLYECTLSLLPLPAPFPGDHGMDSFVFYFKTFRFFSTSKSRSFLMPDTSLRYIPHIMGHHPWSCITNSSSPSSPCLM